MKRTIHILTVLLVVQVGFFVFLMLTKSDTGAFTSTEPLLGIKATTEVDGITIEQPDKAKLLLKKQNDTWILPDHFGFPVSSSKIDPFVQKLLDQKQGWAIAKTRSAAKRFKVSDASFEKKITFSKAGKILKTLFLGSSPGFRKVHVRASGQDNIYAIEFSTYEASVKPQDWVDKSVLHLKRDDIDQIQMPEFTLRREGDRFVANAAGDNEETADDESNALLSEVVGLSFQDVLGTENKPEYQQQKPVFSYTLRKKSGDKLRYIFSQPKNKAYFVLKSSTRNEYFKVSKYTVKRLQEFTKAKLVQAKKAEQTEPSEKPAKTMKEN
jgi:hypothetical protein